MGQLAFQLVLIAILSVGSISVQSTEFSIPELSEHRGRDGFYIELLEKSFSGVGEPLTLKKVPIPQLRATYLLERGGVDLLWMLESRQRNEQFIPIKIGLTNGLIGKRVFLIKKGDSARFSGVDSLASFQQLKLVAGMGKNWFDAKVWRKNELLYREQVGDWQAIYGKVAANREYDYFPRGVNEVLSEAALYPDLEIEPSLVFEYERDFLFYLSPLSAHKYSVLEKALIYADETGLIDALVKKYWGEDLDKLNYEKREKILLVTPK